MPTIYDRLGSLGSPIRVRLMRLLEIEELQVGEIANVVQLPQSTVSRHLKVLHDEGWVDRRREGTSSLFAVATSLPEEGQRLWELVREATDGEHAEDGLRLASVLAARDVDSRAFFGRVAGAWTDLRRELYGDAYVLPALVSLLPDHWTIADLGCGPGEMLVTLAPHVGRVIGVDREPSMLVAAGRRTEGLAGVDLREGTLEAPPLAPGEVDAALLVLVLHHVEDPGVVLAAVEPALAEGGRVVVVDMVAHDRTGYRRRMGHVHLGFEETQVARFAEQAGLVVRHHTVLTPATGASGPALFLAVLSR